MKIAILGTRGIPNNYGGFEQFAEYLSIGLVEAGYDVTVYSPKYHWHKKDTYKGVKITTKFCPEKEIGSGAHFIYDFLCLKDALKREFNIIFEFGYASVALSYILLPFRNSVIVTNMDGLEWKRGKWSPFVKYIFKWFEEIVVKRSTFLISDNKGIQDYIFTRHNKESFMIPYAAMEIKEPDILFLEEYKLDPFSYDLTIARLEPENNLELIIDAYIKRNIERTYVIVGNNQSPYGRFLKSKYKNKKILFLGSIYNKEHLDNLRHYSECYIHGHSVGGTNPSLLEAMAAGSFIFSHDNVFNKNVLDDNAYFFKDSKELENLLSKFSDLQLNRKRMIEANRIKILDIYSHDSIINQYIGLIKKLVK